MRVLHIINSMEPKSGGPSQGIRTLNNAMLKMGVVREVACLDAPESAYLGMDKFQIHCLGPAKTKWNYSAKLILWLKNNIDKFDVVVINGLWLYSSYAVWKVINSYKKKQPDKKLPRVLVMPHGMLDPYFQKADERKLKAVRNWLYWKLVENKVVNDADGLLFTCETELMLARETFKPYHPKKEYNVGYGIDAPEAYNKEMSAAFNKACPGLNNVPYLLFLSRIHSKKGVDLLIKAYIEIHRTAKAGTAIPKLVLAGPGMDTEFGEMLKGLLNEAADVSKDVFLPGMLKGDAKWGAFYGCEAFVLPSHQENFGIAVVEALACAKPVLISNQVNIWHEILAEGGGIVDNDNLSGTQNILKQWVALAEKQKNEMSAKALTAYQNKFTINKFTDKFFTAFSDHD